MKFKFFIGGYFGGHFEVQLKEDQLLFFVDNRSFLNMPPNYIVSTKDNGDWNRLIAFIESLDWKQKYFNNEILDGTQWELTFKSDKKRLSCFGSNEYPDNFDSFINLLKKITVKHKIPNDYL